MTRSRDRRAGGRRTRRDRLGRHRPGGGPGGLERLALVLVSLAFIAVFVVSYMHGAENREPASVPIEMAAVSSAPRRDVVDGQLGVVNAAADGRQRLQPAPAVKRRGVFTICHTGGGTDCVVDGDTVWIAGEKVRVADIDAPETHPSRCSYEADVGAKATARLAELMNMGSFELKILDRDTDRYGRKLRVLVRDGRSLGDQLVAEGLARTWEGRRRPWC